MTAVPVQVRLIRRFISRADGVRAFLIVTLPVAMLLGLFIGIRSATPTAAQAADHRLGVFNGQISLTSVDGPFATSDVARRIAEVLDQLAIENGWVELDASELRVRGTALEAGSVYLREADWLVTAFPHRRTLRSGRRPSAPGEAVVSASLAGAHPIGDPMDLQSGLMPLRVVGSFDDRFEDYDEVLVAPGTWDSFDHSRLRDAGFDDYVQATLYANVEDWDTLAARLADVTAGAADGLADPEPSAWVTTREELPRYLYPPATERRALVYRLPSVLVVVSSVAGWFGIRRRAARRRASLLHAIGVRPALAASSSYWGTAALAMIAGTAALPFGFIFGLGCRVIVDRLSVQPLRPIDDVIPEWARLVAIVAAAAAVGLVAGLLSRGRAPVRSVVDRLRHPLVAIWARRVATVAMVWRISVAMSATELEANQSEIAWLGAALLVLWSPEAVRALCRLGDRLGAAGRLAARRNAAEVGRSVALLSVVVIGIGPPIASMAIRESQVARERSRWSYELPPGQLAIREPRGAYVPDPRALDVAAAVLGQAPVLVETLDSADYEVGWSVPVENVTGRFALSVGVARDLGDLRRLLGPLPDDVASTLVSGGALFLAGSNPVPVVIHRWGPDDDEEVPVTPPLPTVTMRPDQAWSQQFGVFILHDTAVALGLPLAPARAAFDHVTAQDVVAVVDAMEASGLPGYSVRTRDEFEASEPALGLEFGAFGLLVMLFVVTACSTLASARAFGAELGQLVALGLRRRWIRAVLVWQVLFNLLVSIPAGVALAALSIWVTLRRRIAQPLNVPWMHSAMLLLAVAAVAVVSAVVASLRLRRPANQRQ